MSISRQTYADLKRTTMQTFFKICPKELVERHNEQDGLTILKNRSTIYWLHLDNVDEGTLRGLEINSNLTDQAEETEEKVYDVMDGRIGRWDNAEIPQDLLTQFPDWPSNPLTGKLIAPSYNMQLCNPDTQYHFLYKKYHPDSLERKSSYFFIEGEWDSNLSSIETYHAALDHDEEYVNKYVRGQWGISSAQIHRVWADSFLDYTPELLDLILSKGNLFRVMDHGDASPTCCLWFAALANVYICYREYYVPGQPISYHRRNISDLSGSERYSANYADPQIFKKTGQKDGGFWTTANEYADPDIDAPPLFWVAADNNEFATRNRINEILRPQDRFKHPITGNKGPGIYFIKKSPDYQNGCYHAISETQAQRRKLLGYTDGKAIYCDDRAEGVADHAYDPLRYFVAMHGSGLAPKSKPVPQRSFKWYQQIKQKNKNRLVPMSVG